MSISQPATDEALVRVRRRDGSTFLLRVPGEHLQRVLDLANGEFGDPSIELGGPALVKEHP
jgi:hypothetical protein